MHWWFDIIFSVIEARRSNSKRIDSPFNITEDRISRSIRTSGFRELADKVVTNESHKRWKEHEAIARNCKEQYGIYVKD